MSGPQSPELEISVPVLHANHSADLSYQLNKRYHQTRHEERQFAIFRKFQDNLPRPDRWRPRSSQCDAANATETVSGRED